MDRILLESGKRLSEFPPMPLSMGPQEGELWETIPANEAPKATGIVAPLAAVVTPTAFQI